MDMDDDDVVARAQARVRQLQERGLSLQQIADRYGVTLVYIWRLATGTTWTRRSREHIRRMVRIANDAD